MNKIFNKNSDEIDIFTETREGEMTNSETSSEAIIKLKHVSVMF